MVNFISCFLTQFNISWFLQVTQSRDGPPVRAQSAAGRLEPSAQEGFPAPKPRMSKSMGSC